jgi:aldehyde dehydrogenase (NAD+)
MKTRTALLRSQPGEWEVVDVDLEAPRRGEVLVRMAASGLCHSDVHVTNADQRLPVLPLAGGHEGAGVVVQVGPDTDGLEEGDHVVLSFLPVCGRCRMCASGHQSLCDLGAAMYVGSRPDDPESFRMSLDGKRVAQLAGISTLSEHTVVDVRSAVKIDPTVPLDKAALLGCGVATGWGSVTNMADVGVGDVVIVMGVGGVGINAVQGAAAVGASAVIAVDPVERKLDWAVEFGATHRATTIEEGTALAQGMTNGQGADAAVVTVGRTMPEHVAGALASIRKGGTVVVTGTGPAAAPDQLPKARAGCALRRAQPDVGHPAAARPVPGRAARARPPDHSHLHPRRGQPGLRRNARRREPARPRRLRLTTASHTGAHMTLNTEAPTRLPSHLAPRTTIYVGGRWVEPIDGQRIGVDDPTRGEPFTSVVLAGPADADAAVTTARESFDEGSWRGLSPAERGEVLRKVGDVLQRRTEEFLDIAVTDFGLPRAFAAYAHSFSVGIFHDYARMAESLELVEERTGPGYRTLVRREPTGVVVAIVPFNAPTPLAAVKVAPALLAGCSVVMKASPETPLASYLLAEAFEEAGVPAGVLSILPAGREVGERLVADPRVDHVSFTGSTASGRNVMRSAADHIAGVTLELGGKSAAVVMEDADPASTIPMLIGHGLGQSGQVCTAYTRILVSEAQHDEWASALAEAFRAVPMGNPAVEGTFVGPLISADAVARSDRYVRTAVAEGATVLAGGEVPDRPGFFYPATLLDGVAPDATVACEEVFGPVICLLTYRDLDHAVEIANSTPFGLGAGVFGTDEPAMVELAERLDAGAISVGTPGTTMLQPFGGYKQSGIGREGGREGLEAFLEVKQMALPVTPPA